MFIEQFTEHTRRAIMIARRISLDMGAEFLDIDQLFLGLVDKDNTDAYTVLDMLLVNVYDLKHLIRDKLKKFFKNSKLNDPNREVPFTDGAKKILENAIHIANLFNFSKVTTHCMLLAIFEDGSSFSARLMAGEDVEKEEILGYLRTQESKEIGGCGSNKPVNTTELDKYSVDLTKKARSGSFDPVICRDKEIMRLIQILGRRSKNNPILVGEPGVGKTAIVEGLAQMVVANKVPSFLRNIRIVSLDISLVLSGTKYRGMFEERMKAILKDIKENKNIILFIDEAHMIVSAGQGDSNTTNNMSNIMKPYLARGDIHCIGATTLKEYKQSFEKDGALERRFQKIIVEPLSVRDTITVLGKISSKYETFHNVKKDEGILEKIVLLADKYIHGREFPDKAIDIFDEALVLAKMSDFIEVNINDLIKKFQQCDDLEKKRELKKQLKHIDNFNCTLTYDLVLKVVYNITGIPVHELNENITEKVKDIYNNLSKRVIGQDKAIKTLSRSIKKSMVGIHDANRPMGSFIFLGPSGVGKTELVKCLAENLFGSRDSIVRLDMSEYNDKMQASRIIGSAPGYIGCEEGGQLTEKIKRNPYSIILVDEIEKAHMDVINMFLQILDEGHLTDSQGVKVNFKNTIIVMTSNVGTEAFTGVNSLGFIQKSEKCVKIEENVLSMLSEKFPVEFINRVDNIVIFNDLDKNALENIVDLQIGRLNERLKDRNLKVSVDQSAVNWLIENGYNKKYGARYINRYIKTYIEDELANKIIEDEVSNGDYIVIESDGIRLNLCVTERIDA